MMYVLLSGQHEDSTLIAQPMILPCCNIYVPDAEIHVGIASLAAANSRGSISILTPPSRAISSRLLSFKVSLRPLSGMLAVLSFLDNDFVLLILTL